MTFLIALTLLAIGLQIYHYILYPLLITVLAALAPGRRPPSPDVSPRVTLIICAYNEAGVIAEKIHNSCDLVPPADEIIVVCDGSDDGTERVADAAAAGLLKVNVMFQPARQGKAAAMNRAAARADGDILLFSDANALYSPSTIAAIQRGFDDPSVAVVSGAKHTRGVDGVGVGDGLYWRYEAWIRHCEARIASTVAAVGEIVAVRRTDWQPIPAGTVNDDAWLTLSNLARGRRVIYSPDAKSYEEASPDHRFETQRRRRMNAGRLRLLADADNWPWRYPWPLFAFLSHKVLRLLLPILMLVGFSANFAVVLQEPSPVFLDVLFWLQLAGVAMVLTGGLAARLSWRLRMPLLAYHVFCGNFAALLAMWDMLRGRSYAIWEKPAR